MKLKRSPISCNNNELGTSLRHPRCQNIAIFITQSGTFSKEVDKKEIFKP